MLAIQVGECWLFEESSSWSRPHPSFKQEMLCDVLPARDESPDNCHDPPDCLLELSHCPASVNPTSPGSLFSSCTTLFLLFWKSAWAFLQRTLHVLCPVSRRILPPAPLLPLWIPAQMLLPESLPHIHPSALGDLIHLLFTLPHELGPMPTWICNIHWGGEHLLSSLVKSKKAGFVFGWSLHLCVSSAWLMFKKCWNEGMNVSSWFVSKTIFRMPSVFQFLTLSHLL